MLSVHMNGRVYDPNLARFVSADLLIPEPKDTQSYNRYSYVYNRPMNFTDPTGFDSDGVEDDSEEEEQEEQEEEEELPPTPGEVWRAKKAAVDGVATIEDRTTLEDALQHQQQESANADTVGGGAKNEIETQTENLDDDEESAGRVVSAKWGKKPITKEHNPTNGAVVCDNDCRASAGAPGFFATFEQMDYEMAALRLQFYESQVAPAEYSAWMVGGAGVQAFGVVKASIYYGNISAINSGYSIAFNNEHSVGNYLGLFGWAYGSSMFALTNQSKIMQLFNTIKMEVVGCSSGGGNAVCN